ncbi:MAG TPA: hypothetical protein VL171_13060 [Verrucomicrobiae bacterium]|nr:hypothetical protein [Verrucomicrobiae bacterium]
MKNLCFTRQFAVPAIIGLLIVFSATPGVAQVPSGTFSYIFTNLPLWDISGSYTNDSSVNDATDHVIMNLTQSATGKITGTRTDSINGVGSANFTRLKGRVAVKHRVVGARVKMRGMFQAYAYRGLAVGTGNGTIDPSGLSIDISGHEKLCVNTPRGTGCESFSADSTYALPATMNGDWTLDTDISANADKLSGTGTLTLSNGRVLNYKIKGTYNAGSDLAKLKLVGQGDAIGTSLSLTAQGADMAVTVLKGKVLGQKPMFP